MTSAFAAAAQQAAGQTTTAPATGQAQTNPLPFNTGNPFAKASDFGGSGDFTPTPPLDVLAGRTLVYIPRSFNPAAPNPLGGTTNPTRPQWTCDLYVLDGGKLSFWYKRKGNVNATPPTADATVEWVQEDVSPTSPFEAKGAYVSQTAFIKKIQGASDARQLLVGTPVRGAQKAQRDNGQTDEQVRAEHAAWLARGKQGSEPKFVWLLQDVEDMAPVMAWWEQAKDSVKL